MPHQRAIQHTSCNDRSSLKASKEKPGTIRRSHERAIIYSAVFLVMLTTTFVIAFVTSLF